jgi:hypothetical protein
MIKKIIVIIKLLFPIMYDVSPNSGDSCLCYNSDLSKVSTQDQSINLDKSMNF